MIAVALVALALAIYSAETQKTPAKTSQELYREQKNARKH